MATTKKTPVKSKRTKVAAKVANKKNLSLKKKFNKFIKTSKKSRNPVFKNLNLWNWVAGLTNAIQGVVLLVIAKEKLFAVSTNYQTLDKLAPDVADAQVHAVHQLFDINIVYVIASFLLISAVIHILAATVCRKHYEEDIDNKVNKLRWIDYALSAGMMTVTVALLIGVQSFSLLVSVFLFTALGSLLGLVMETVNNDKNTKNINWLPMILGFASILIAWFIIGVYLVGSRKYGISGSVETYVNYILASVFVLSVLPSVISKLSFKHINRWTDYIYTEKSFIVVSVIARSALAWQIYAGLIR